MSRSVPYFVAGVLAGAVILSQAGAEAAAPTAPATPAHHEETVPASKLAKAVAGWRSEHRRANRLARLLGHRESYRETLRIVGVIEGPRAPIGLADKIIRCESGGNADARNPHSTAGGRGQYLDSTWAGTGFARAGISRFSPVAAVFQVVRDLMAGGPGPWTASAGCWGG